MYEPEYDEKGDDGDNNDLDGCTTECVIEDGWDGSGSVVHSPSVGNGIGGDLFRVSDETGDDGDKNDSEGGLADGSGEIDGWHCTGGDHTQPDVGTEQGNDGFITMSEGGEDGNIDDLDGGDSNCQVETGWIGTNNTALTYSDCQPIGGDGLLVGPESCDDYNDDLEGGNSDCNGQIKGWYCTPTNLFPAHTGVTHQGDGIHIAGWEDGDDGNTLDSGDGGTNSGIVETKWICNDNLLQMSICEPLCGDGLQNHPDEEGDDFNYESRDGCSKDGIIEQGWEGFNGSSTTSDQGAKKPIAEIDSHSKLNNITILFTEDMEKITLVDSINVTISGPLAPYKSIIDIEFVQVSPLNTLNVNITLKSLMAGGKQDRFNIIFDTTLFKNKKGPTLITEQLNGSLYKVPQVPDVIAIIGSSTNQVISLMVVVLITSNLLLSQSSELMWGFLNTLQIIFFFPLLELYYPDAFSQLLPHFSSSKMRNPIPKVGELQTNLQKPLELTEKLDMPVPNERYKDLEYESSGFLSSGSGIITMILQSIFTLIVVFGFKGLLITLRGDINSYEQRFENFDKETTPVENIEGYNIESNLDTIENIDEDSKYKVWMRNKIIELSQEYKYNFFLRVGLQVYLEVVIISLLNFKYYKTENIYQVISLSLSIFFFSISVLFCLWSIYTLPILWNKSFIIKYG